MRYELKYQTFQLTLDQCKQIVRLHPSLFKKTYEDRWVNNIYLDTPDLKCFYDNMNGISERVKYRIRWYGPDWNHIKDPKLEIKKKENALGEKHSFEIDDIPLQSLNDSLKNLKDEHKISYGLTPTAYNRYLRSYFATGDGKFRITLDCELSYANHFCGGGIPRFPVSGIICELKYDESWEYMADEVRQYIPFRQTKFSKYVEGIIHWLE